MSQNRTQNSANKKATTTVCCTTCPKECIITIVLKQGELTAVTGQGCNRGKQFAKKEMRNPERTLTSTVIIDCGGRVQLLAVKTAAPIPKKDMALVMNAIRKTRLRGPCHLGDVVTPNICDTGVDLVACRSIREVNHAH